MGSAFRGGDHRRAQTKAVELVPSRPRHVRVLLPGRGPSWPTRTARCVITDGRNHVELTTDRYDIVVTDPPPPIFSSGASVISSLEYYPGRPRPPGAGRRDDAVAADRLDA